MKNSNGYSAEKDVFVTWQDFTKRMQATTVSEADWSAFFQRYKKYIEYSCHIHLGIHNAEIIELIVEEVFLKILNDDAIHTFNHRHDIQGSLRAWLKKYTRNAKTKVLRDLKKTKQMDIESIDKMLSDGQNDDDALAVIGTDSEKMVGDDVTWKHYVAFLALDEIRRKSIENPIQFQSFIGVVYNGRKPSELADLLGISSLQISENVRAVKNKLKTALKNMEEKYPIEDIESFDWEKFKQEADNAKEEIDAINEQFSQGDTGK